MITATLVLAAIELVSPVKNAEVALVPDDQKTVITNEALATRISILDADRAGDKNLEKSKFWRKANPVYFTWLATDGEKGPWEVLLGKKPDLSDARQFLITGWGCDDATGRSIPGAPKNMNSFKLHYANLEIATTYYWRVAGNVTCGKFGHARQCGCTNRCPIVTSEIASFRTEDLAPRWIEILGQTRNFRDLGGRIGLGGKRVRQGMIYRSQGLNDNSIDGITKGRNRLTVSDVEYLTGTLGIRTDLDLRGPGEVGGLNGVSPLGKDIIYINNSSGCYREIEELKFKKMMAKNFRVFLNRDSYPILFHCIGGADRTGALGYVLNAVLGVPRRELETDWESTFYPHIPDGMHPGEPDYWCLEAHFNNLFGRYGDEKTSWNDRVALYLKDCGITDDEIAEFREIMLEK